MIEEFYWKASRLGSRYFDARFLPQRCKKVISSGTVIAFPDCALVGAEIVP